MGEPVRILVVDDEPRWVRAVQVNLETSGYNVDVAYDGQSALALAQTVLPDLVILDLRMPGMDGFEVCRRIRAFSTVPIILLTGLAEDTDKAKGLDTGADDYLTKPFNVDELLARVRATLRRRDSVVEPLSLPVSRSRDLLVDFDLERVFVQGKEVELTSTEFSVLCELIRNSGQMLTHEHLLDLLQPGGEKGDATQIEQVVLQLRRKIEPDPDNPEYIVVRAGAGYGFQAPG